MSSKSKRPIIGYKYFFGTHLGLCLGPIDKITKIFFDKKLAWEGIAAGGDITINAPDLFGGTNREGGISGTFTIAMGYPNQERNTYLMRVLKPKIAAFRGLVSVIGQQTYWGTHYYLKSPGFLATRIYKTDRGTAQWQGSLAEPTPGNMNPAHIIRELVTSKRMGLGRPVNLINETNFVDVATTLKNESFGLSFFWNDDSTVEDFLKLILQHIDASFYMNLVTGLYEIKLIRQDYDVNTILSLGVNEIKEIRDYQHQTIEELYNQVNLKFWNSTTMAMDAVQVNNPAMAQRQGVTIPYDITLEGIPDKNLALTVAYRILKQVSTDTTTMIITADRTAETLNIGSVAKITWPDLNLTNFVVRIIDIDLGTLTDNKITLKVAKDIYSMDLYTGEIPPNTSWVDPVSAPSPVTKRLVQEAPYYIIAREQGDTFAQGVSTNSGYIACAGKTPTSDAYSANIYTNNGAGYTTNSSILFCPYCELTGPIGYTATLLSISNISNWDLMSTGTMIQFDNEIMKIVSFTDTSLVVERGCCDTLPAQHLANASGYAWEIYNGGPSTEYLNTENVSIKLATITAKGALDYTVAPVDTVTIALRMHKPYPPGNFKINNVPYPISIVGDAVVTWSHRNRLTETAQLYGQTYGDITPETGTTYNCRLYNGATLIDARTGLTGTTTTFTGMTALNNPRIELESVRNGLISSQKYNVTFYVSTPQVGDTLTATATIIPIIGGTLASTQANNVLNSSGALLIKGTATITQDNNTSNSSSSIISTGQTIVIQQSNTLTSIGSGNINGSLIISQSANTIAANSQVAPVPSTWNPSDKNASISLSNANKDATYVAGLAWGGVRGTDSRTGKFYMEVQVVVLSGGNMIIGIGNSTYNLNDYLGATANSYGISNLGVGYGTGGTFSKSPSNPVGYAQGDIIGIALDTTLNRIYFYINNVLAITYFDIASSTAYFPALSLNTTTHQVSLRTIINQFSYSVPSGFSPWN